MRTVTVPVIKTEDDYRQVLASIENLWVAPAESDDGDTLEVMMILVEAYEESRFPIDLSDSIEAIKFRMNQAGYNRRDLESLLGKSRVAELLNRKRGLSLNMIRKLHKEWKIPAELLIGEGA